MKENEKKTEVQPPEIKVLETHRLVGLRIKTGLKAGTIGPVTPW
jgi:hypothetical protein